VWSVSADDRPVPAHDVINTGPVSLIRVIERIAYVDLRRELPGAWAGPVALAHLEEAFETLLTVGGLTHVVWVTAPWVLELIDEPVVDRIEKLVARIPAAVAQRLAIVAPEGQPIGPSALVRRLGPRLPPVSKRLSQRTQQRGAFSVGLIDALHDAYFFEAWKRGSPG
jgi:hypothetical protein